MGGDAGPFTKGGITDGSMGSTVGTGVGEVGGLGGTVGSEGVAGGEHEKLPRVFIQISSDWQESVPDRHSSISTARVRTLVKKQLPMPAQAPDLP